MTTTWEQCRREGAALEVMLAAFQAGGDARELAEVVRNEEDRGDALFILSELPMAVSRPVWRCALDYVGDSDLGNALDALSTVHAFIAEADARELLHVLRSVNLAEPGVFTKSFAIMLSVSSDLLRRAADLAREEAIPAGHAEGLGRVAAGSGVPAETVRAMVEDPDIVTRFYGCSLVGRHHPDDPILSRLLPARVRTRLELHGEVERNGRGDSPDEDDR